MTPDSLATAKRVTIGQDVVEIARAFGVFEHPEAVIDAACAQTFAAINPHYPGVRAAIAPSLLQSLTETVAELTRTKLGYADRTWSGEAWYSIVTQTPDQLTPIQRLPHFDGFDADQVAIMIYLNQTAHGGTAFFRHKATGFERITEDRYPAYKQRLERDIRASGLPPARYNADGGPHFDLIGTAEPTFNSLVLYPGNALHSGVIRNDIALPSDPQTGRLTINGFFRPA